MTTQREALRLADELSKSHLNHYLNHAAAFELRRLHVVEKQREDLLTVLKATAEALAHYVGNSYEPVVEAQAAITKAERTTT